MVNNKEVMGGSPCWVCGKVHKRLHVNNYYYFGNHLVCSNHKGAKEWYNGAIELGKEKLRLINKK